MMTIEERVEAISWDVFVAQFDELQKWGPFQPEGKLTNQSFKTITSAIKALDEAYSREYWTNNGGVDTIIINGVYTYVSYGFRMDPSTDKEYKYFRTLECNMKYSFCNIRLS